MKKFTLFLILFYPVLLFCQQQDQPITLSIESNVKYLTFAPVVGFELTENILSQLTNDGKIIASRDNANPNCLILKASSEITTEDLISLAKKAGFPVDPNEVNKLFTTKKLF